MSQALTIGDLRDQDPNVGPLGIAILLGVAGLEQKDEEGVAELPDHTHLAATLVDRFVGTFDGATKGLTFEVLKGFSLSNLERRKEPSILLFPLIDLTPSGTARNAGAADVPREAELYEKRPF